MLAAIAPDADGVFFWNRDLWEHTHHTVGHNVFFAAGLVALATAMARKDRRARVAGLVAVSVLFLHYGLDLAISATWPMRPFWPVSQLDISPGMFVTDTAGLDWWLRVPVQWALVALAIALTVHAWRRHGRSAFELLSDKLDDLIAGYLARMLRGARCAECGARAGFRCASCHASLCGTHTTLHSFEAFCDSCRDGVVAAPS